MAGRLVLSNTGAAPLRARYDATNYADFTVSSTGDLTITPTGGDTNVEGRFSASGNVGIGRAPVSSHALSVALAGLAGADQRAAFFDMAGTSEATSLVAGVTARVGTVAATFTTPDAVTFYALNPSKGAGSTITNAYGLFVQPITAGTNNYAIYTSGGHIRLGGLPTSATGLAAGTLWNDAGVVKVA